MKSWNDIVNKATLGSAKQRLLITDIPERITQEFEWTNTPDAEEDFLRYSSLVYQYRQTGALPLNIQTLDQSESEKENKTYCTEAAGNTLKTILEEELYSFLELWLQRCASKSLCVTPDLIPSLLDVAIKRKELRKRILEVSGKRGEWLCSLNPAWNFSSASQDKNTVWENGKIDERKELLINLRQENSAGALDLLKTTWATEGANEKTAFLEILKINLSSDDLEWLEGLKEKGQKVNSAIQDLLLSIPNASIVQAYRQVLKDSIHIKTGKALLGMINKTTLEIRESLDVPENIFKSGIEKLSSDKNVSDHHHILLQLIAAVPPSLWNDQFSLPTDSVISLFQKEKETTRFIPSLAMAAVKFNDRDWIKKILDLAHEALTRVSIVHLMTGLTDEDREIYARKFLKEMPEIIQLMANQRQEWSMELAKMILKYTANETYSYNRTFYRSVTSLIPVEIINVLPSFEPSEEPKKVYWKNQSEELIRLLTLKQHILQSLTA